MRTIAEILADIAALEDRQARPIREFTLSGNLDTAALARIREIDARLVDLRAELIAVAG